MSETTKLLLLIRGLPGSGKSTLANLLASPEGYPVFSVDDFFTDEFGHYQFRFEDNHLAYKSCEERCRKAMMEGIVKIFIDNTFTLEWEMLPYYKMASEFGYQVHVVTAENRHEGENIHNVTQEQLEKMKEKFKLIL
jgi:predicted kinase